MHRLFESLKRADHELNAEGEALEKVQESRLKRKKAARTHRVRRNGSSFQLYERRKAMVKESERRIWEKVSRELMIDESDMSDGTIVRHCLPWRSESRFI